MEIKTLKNIFFSSWIISFAWSIARYEAVMWLDNLSNNWHKLIYVLQLVGAPPFFKRIFNLNIKEELKIWKNLEILKYRNLSFYVWLRWKS